MRNALLATAALALALPLAAQDSPAPSPGEIVAQAAADEWVAIPAEQLLVMTLSPDAEGNARQVVIQLMPPPFSQGWVDNIRLLARSGWYDNISVNRVQDNYVVQWGDPNYDNPEATGETKPLPDGLRVVEEAGYGLTFQQFFSLKVTPFDPWQSQQKAPPEAPPQSSGSIDQMAMWMDEHLRLIGEEVARARMGDSYAPIVGFAGGFPVAQTLTKIDAWPVHCYGMVGVGRNLSPDTGSGAELYTVIGHAPRHLDRNIALVGRVIEGMEHLSSLPRGKGALGFYGPEEVSKRTPILTVRMASDLAPAEQPRFEYLNTDGETFARYAEARANRRDPFFNVPAGGADICNIPVPVRRVAE